MTFLAKAVSKRAFDSPYGNQGEKSSLKEKVDEGAHHQTDCYSWTPKPGRSILQGEVYLLCLPPAHGLPEAPAGHTGQDSVTKSL